MNAKPKQLNFKIMKKFLKIDNAIIISNAERIKNGKEIIKDKKHLARLIEGDGNFENFYMRLYRAEKEGFINENKEMIDKLLTELNVPKDIILSDI